MATINTLVWNIRTFGAFERVQKGDGNERVNATISGIGNVIAYSDVDIVVIQEFRFGGRNFLPRLAAFLDGEDGAGEWSYDYLPGASTGTGAITGIGDLAYTSAGNQEGYAVLWRGDVLEPFATKVSVGQNGIAGNQGYISLVSLGAAPQFDYLQHRSITRLNNDFTPRLKVPTPWGFPVVNGAFANSFVLRDNLARLPCRINIRAADAGTPIDFIVWHATAKTPGCAYSVYCWDLIESLVNDNTKKTIVSGDFNLTTQNNFTQLGLVAGGMNLVNGTALPDIAANKEFGYYRTLVRYSIPTRPASLATNAQCYEHPRDILFYRNNIDDVNSSVLDIVSLLQDADTGISRRLFYDTDIRDAVVNAADEEDNYSFQDVVFTSATLPDEIKAPFENAVNKNYTNNLSATVYYRAMISDHLPIHTTFSN
ncbi:MAG: endonuclease/exonuclease/phosphatase family protein [Flavobacteriales bacterium]|nr:endonuclease/exonuclease/phosphatase family protein [Flavobacteriales bacterium]